MARAKTQMRQAWGYLLGAIVLYLGIQILVILRTPLNPDEFQGAYTSYRLLRETPYTDFLPYKTVLGYYAQLPPLLLPLPTWETLLAEKFYLAFLNAIGLVLIALGAAKFYDARAVLLALYLLVCVTTFAERSSEIRVDMLTGWIGVLSILTLMDRKLAWAGALAGLSVLISQKGAFYVIGGGAGIILATRGSSFKDLVAASARYGGPCLLVVGIYAAFWTAVTDFSIFSQTAVVSAVEVATRRDVYPDIRWNWAVTMVRNPLFYGLAAWALTKLALDRYRVARHAERKCPPGAEWQSSVLLASAGAIVLAMAAYTQPWPYFFVLLLPVLFLVVSWHLDAVIYRRGFLVPADPLFVSTFVALGFGLPLALIAKKALGSDPDRQRETVELAERLLQPGDMYWAGATILFREPQQPWLGWLDRHAIQTAESMSDMQVGDRLAKIDALPTKLVFDNYRIASLPAPFADYVRDNYAPYARDVLIYSPRIPPGQSRLRIKFSGRYRFEGGPVLLGGRRLEEGWSGWLDAGLFEARASESGRLYFVDSRVPAESTRGEALPDFFGG